MTFKELGMYLNYNLIYNKIDFTYWMILAVFAFKLCGSGI